MTVRFQTDNSVVDLGFSAVWTEVLSQGGFPTQPSSIYSPASSFTNQQGKLTLMQIHADTFRKHVVMHVTRHKLRPLQAD